jgi:PAS domain S-box-containing protein
MVTDAPIVGALFGAVALNVVVAAIGFRRRGDEPGATALTVFALALAFGTLTVVMEVTATSMGTKVSWFGLGLVFQAVVVGSWFYFALAYTGLDRWTGRRTVGLLAVEPLVMVVVFAVPILRSFAVETQSTVTRGVQLREVAGTTIGPAIIVHGLYAFVLVLAATVVFVQFFVRSRRLDRTQAAAVLFAAMLPWAAILFESFTALIPVDTSLFAWPVAGLIMAVALSRFRVLDPVSAGRETVVEEMGDGVVLVDRDDRIGDINPTARQLLDVDDDVDGDPVDTVVPLWADVREADGWHEVNVTVDGHDKYLETETTPFYDQHDRLVGRLVVFRDVTTRKRREQSLARFKTVFESVQDRVFVLDERGRFVLVNEPFATFVGHDSAALLGEQFDDLLADGAVPANPDAEVGPTEVIVETADGDVPCEVLLSPVAFEDDTGTVGVIRDISERKRVERSLQETTERFETLVEASPLAIMAADRDGVVDVWNPAAEELFGWPAEDVIGRELPIVPAEHRADVVEYHERVLAGERITGIEIPLERSDGTRIRTSTSVAPLYDASGEVEGNVAVIADISDRVEREEKLKRQNERLDEFASIVSHDLRNPLQVAEGYAEHARSTGEVEHVDAVVDALERMEDLIESVLTLARKGQDIEDPRPVALERAVSLAWDRAPTASATLDVCDPPETILSDETRLTELLGNLFRNAVEHAGSDVAVTVGSLEDGFYVADDGPGIPDGDRRRVFESGYSTADGTGLGLAIVRRIAEAHGWDVTLTTSESGGARFEFHGVERVDSPVDPP